MWQSSQWQKNWATGSPEISISAAPQRQAARIASDMGFVSNQGVHARLRRRSRIVLRDALLRIAPQDEGEATVTTGRWPERRIKGWSRAKKEAYMRGDFPALVALSQRGPKTDA
ncbi:MAG: hypothetical protein WAK41_11220 [Roseiarcus sp.]